MEGQHLVLKKSEWMSFVCGIFEMKLEMFFAFSSLQFKDERYKSHLNSHIDVLKLGNFVGSATLSHSTTFNLPFRLSVDPSHKQTHVSKESHVPGPANLDSESQ